MNPINCTQDYSTASVPIVASLPVQCAWCMVEAGIELGNGSHGICEAHATLLLTESRARRAKKVSEQ